MLGAAARGSNPARMMQMELAKFLPRRGSRSTISPYRFGHEALTFPNRSLQRNRCCQTRRRNTEGVYQRNCVLAHLSAQCGYEPRNRLGFET
jgi:hypothetical protein